jgi:hypothetical protein
VLDEPQTPSRLPGLLPGLLIGAIMLLIAIAWFTSR